MNRVLVFSGHFHPHVGGVERYSRELWKRFPARGWKVRLVTSNTDRSPSFEVIDGIEVFRLPVFNIVQGRLPLPFPSREFYRSLNAVLDIAPDVIVTNTRFFYTSVLGVRTARKLHVPVLHIDHGSAFIGLGNPIMSACGRLFDRIVGGWVLQRADCVVGVSAAVNQFLAALGRKSDGILYNGVDSASYGAVPAKLREELRLAADDILILFVGRLLEDKGILILLDAFKRISGDGSLHLAILGDGPMGALVSARARDEERVHFLGFRGPEQVREALASADIFVHPSYYPEGLPTSVLEAGASGRAIIATDAGGTPEIIDSPEQGVLIAQKDCAALAEAIVHLASDGEKRAQLGLSVASRVSQVFDWGRIADTAETYLKDTVDRARSAANR